MRTGFKVVAGEIRWASQELIGLSAVLHTGLALVQIVPHQEFGAQEWFTFHLVEDFYLYRRGQITGQINSRGETVCPAVRPSWWFR